MSKSRGCQLIWLLCIFSAGLLPDHLQIGCHWLYPLYLNALYCKLCIFLLISLINPFSATSSLRLMFGNLFILLTAYFFSSLVGFTYCICSSSFCFSGASGGRDTKASVFSPNLNWTLRLLLWWEEIKCVGTAFSPYAEKNALCFSHSKHRWEVFSISTINWVFKF